MELGLLVVRAGLLPFPIAAVAKAQHHGGQQRCDERSHQYPALGVIVGRMVRGEAQLSNEQRDREPDAGELPPTPMMSGQPIDSSKEIRRKRVTRNDVATMPTGLPGEPWSKSYRPSRSPRAEVGMRPSRATWLASARTCRRVRTRTTGQLAAARVASTRGRISRR